MIPWIVITALNGDMTLSICLLVLYIIMIVIRQLIEPKIVSNQIGIHPIFTLIAMYTGFKLMNVVGLLVGPIILIIIKNIFQSLIEEGIVKSILAKK